MRRTAVFLFLLAAGIAWSMPAHAQKENRKIGENSIEARKAAKQYQKAAKKTAKKQRKAMKKIQKQQRQQQRHK